VHDDAEVLVAV
jgi:hypothetical protein